VSFIYELIMAAYDPSDRSLSSVQYMVETTGDQWFIPTTGYGDNPASGTMAQRVAACTLLTGKKSDGSTDLGTEVVV
jgi:hypothetical protein